MLDFIRRNSYVKFFTSCIENLEGLCLYIMKMTLPFNSCFAKFPNNLQHCNFSVSFLPVQRVEHDASNANMGLIHSKRACLEIVLVECHFELKCLPKASASR